MVSTTTARIKVAATDSTPETVQTDSGDFTISGGSTIGYVMGTVTNKNTSQPIQGANVSASGSGIDSLANGTYILPIATGTYTVTCTKTGYVTGSQSGVQVQKDKITKVDFKLLPIVVNQNGTITGTVKDNSTNNPINGASVSTSPATLSANTDAAGVS